MVTLEASLALAGRISEAATPRHQRTEVSSVTTAWGVNWDEEFIARDILQNFFDANRNQVAEVAVDVNGRDVSITGPAAFRLEELLYLGSTKDEDDVGKYGEGFKAAAVCLLRNHGVTPVIISGQQILCIRVAEETAPGTDFYPLLYDFFTTDAPFPGTRLLLPGCSPKLARCLKAGLSHFFFAENPLLGDRLWSDWRGNFAIYASTTEAHGHIFYRNLKRGEVPDIPVVLVINKEYAIIEKKIKSDRDRNAFGSELLKDFYSVFAQHGLNQDREGAATLLERARPCWSRGQGHPLLERVAWAYAVLLDDDKAGKLFGAGYFASSTSKDFAEQLRYTEVETEWQRQGRVGLPGYFAKFGVISAARHFGDLYRKARQESHATDSRRPTVAETGALSLLSRTLKDLAPAIGRVFERDGVAYTVARTEVVLGELKQERSYRSLKVFLAEQVFEADFAEALAVYLHEHAHIFGFDGSRGFTDALTELLGTVVRHRQDLDTYEAEWVRAKESVLRERQNVLPKDTSGEWTVRLAAMSADELRALLSRMPPVTVRSALEAPRGEEG